jgi:hypothetical protein
MLVLYLLVAFAAGVPHMPSSHVIPISSIANGDYIPYHRVSHRPDSPGFCKALYPFCPNQTALPTFLPDDEVEVWALQAPVWEFKYGDLMGKFKVFHDAVGFKNKRTGPSPPPPPPLRCRPQLHHGVVRALPTP